MARVDPYELADDDEPPEPSRRDPERDGVEGLHDTEAEAGDEAEVVDDFDLDEREARELGVRLDDTGEDEPRLD
jgi:hypothetical protein